MELLFTISRNNCAVDFLLHTAMQLPVVREENERKGWHSHPYGASIGYHSPVAQYSGQTVNHCNCDHTGGDCYYDSSGLGAKEPAEDFIRDPESLWRTLLTKLEKLEGDVEREKQLARNFS